MSIINRGEGALLSEKVGQHLVENIEPTLLILAFTHINGSILYIHLQP